MPDQAGNPLFYLDTNVLLDVIERRRPASVDLLALLRERQWMSVTSPFSILEILEATQTERWARKQLERGWSFSQIQRRFSSRRTASHRLSTGDLNQIYRELSGQLQPILEIVTLPQATASLMDRAEDICASTNIEATDSFHLATALEARCDILISGDSDFCKLARDYIIAARPENVDRALQEFRS